MKKEIFKILFLTFLSLSVQTLQAQEIVKAELDSTAILIGDQVGLHLRISNADGISQPNVDLEPLKQVAELEIVNELEWDTLDIMGNRVLQKDIILTSFDSGYYFIPSLKINYKKQNTKVSRATSQLALGVNTMQTDPMTVAPIKDIIREPLKLIDFLWLFVLLALLALAVAGFFYYNKRKQKEEPQEVYVAPKPAHEIALLKLKELKEAKLWQQGNIKAYQSQLTYIVREYLENRYDIQALEQTSDQILRSMKNKSIEQSHRDKLQEMFTMADLVKFAKAEPPVDANEKLMDYAENFVRKTKKIIVEEVSTNENQPSKK